MNRIDVRHGMPLLVGTAMLALYLLLALVRATLVPHDHNPDDRLVISAIGLLLAQWSFAAGWAALGDGSWLLRLTGLSWTIVVPTLAIEWIAPDGPLALLLVLALIYAALVAIPLGVARLGGYHCRLPSATSKDSAQGRQFSIRQILIVTTVVAIVMAIMRWVQFKYDDTNEIVMMAIIFLSPAILAWLAFPLLIRAPLPIAWSTFLLAAVALGAIINGALTHRPDPTIWELIALLLIQAISLGSALTALRVVGYRLERSSLVPMADGK